MFFLEKPEHSGTPKNSKLTWHVFQTVESKFKTLITPELLRGPMTNLEGLLTFILTREETSFRTFLSMRWWHLSSGRWSRSDLVPILNPNKHDWDFIGWSRLANLTGTVTARNNYCTRGRQSTEAAFALLTPLAQVCFSDSLRFFLLELLTEKFAEI